MTRFPEFEPSRPTPKGEDRKSRARFQILSGCLKRRECERLRPSRTPLFKQTLSGLQLVSLVVGRWSLIVGLLALLFLAGCGPDAGEPAVESGPGGGSDIGPERVAENFFDDLHSALKDPQLADDDKRGQWVERLAGYFAPSERDDQRIALRAALDGFVAGLDKLEPNENMSIELRLDGVEKVSESDTRATVRPINGSINILITRTTETGVATLYQDNVSLDRIIGNSDGTVPVVRVGRTWYLTEG